jgi:hypothetical protein
LIEKNKQIAIDLPICSNKKIERTNYLNNIVIPNLNSVNQKIADTRNTVAIFVNYYNSRNTNLSNGIQYYTNEINKCNTDINNLEAEFRRRRHLPTGNYSIKSLKTDRYCTDLNHIECNAPHRQQWENFRIENLGGNATDRDGGLFLIRGGRGGQICSDDGPFVCNRGALGAWEYTRIHYLGRGIYAFRGGKFGKFCRLSGWVSCDTWNLDTWEKYEIMPFVHS